jgi:hypothetical protein
MKNCFGPWVTYFGTGSNPQLSAFWRRRMTRLGCLDRTKQLLSRLHVGWLVIVGVLMVGLPTVRSISATADESSRVVEDGRTSTTDQKTLKEAGREQIQLSGDEETKNYCDYDTWQLDVKLKVRSPGFTAVQYALFDTDPVAGFADRVRNMRDANRQRYLRADEVARKNWKSIVRSTLISSYWNKGFSSIPGNQVYLLRSPKGGLSSLDPPGGKHWLVTKCESIDGRPVCWCIPVELQWGKRIHVTLTEENQFDLGAAFDAASRDWAKSK